MTRAYTAQESTSHGEREWRVVADGKPIDSSIYTSLEVAQTVAERLTAVDAAEEAVAAVVGAYEYGITVWREGSRWLITDPHTGREGFAFAWYAPGTPPVSVYTRAQYEAACAAVDLVPAADDELGTYSDQYSQSWPHEVSAKAMIELSLRRRRMAGIEREVPAAAAAAVPGAPADGDVRPRAGQGADRVADLLGLPRSAATARGVCHYCGLPLGPHGCPECD